MGKILKRVIVKKKEQLPNVKNKTGIILQANIRKKKNPKKN